MTKFFIIGKKEYKKKYDKILQKKPYNDLEKRYEFVSYDSIINYYNIALQNEKLKFY